MNYYRVTLHYDYAVVRRYYKSSHLIRAKSDKEAVRIVEKYGISYPWNCPDVVKKTVHKLNLRNRSDKQSLESRRRGINGSVFYEENLELKTEQA